MSSAEIFEYRHKKFDKAKRPREDDCVLVENSRVLDLSNSSETSISSKSISSSIHQTKEPRIIGPKYDDFEHKLQRVDHEQCMEAIPLSTTEKNNDLNGNIQTTSDHNILVKKELLESDTEAASSSEIPSPKRRKKETIKIEPQSPPDIKIKEELIEVNARLPTIPRETYEEICKFRRNMVRKFPKKDRSAKEQERRDKNTYACRKSRRVKKIEQVAVEEEYKKFKDINLMMEECAIRAAAYFKELLNKNNDISVSEVIVVD